MNTQYRKNLKDVATACKNYTDKKIEDLKWELGSHTLDVENDTTTAYTKTVPSGTIKCHINKIGGMSYKSENLVNESTLTFNQYTVSGSYSQYRSFTGFNIYLVSGTYSFNSNAFNDNFYIAIEGNTIQSNYSSSVVFDSGYNSLPFTFTLTQDLYCGLYFKKVVNNADQIFTASDLSQYYYMLNTGSTALPYQPYFEGIRDSAVTSVVSKDSNDTTLDTFTIPAEVQALDGYGWGVNDTCYNYIDNEIKKFMKKVGRVDLGTLDWSLRTGETHLFQCGDIRNIVKRPAVTNIKANIICAKYNEASTDEVLNHLQLSIAVFTSGYMGVYDENYSSAEAFTTAMSGVYLYFELATPVETDISEYIDNNVIEVEEGGSLTFDNTYEQAVPSDIDYLIEEVKA